jgi:hypothetical protein
MIITKENAKLTAAEEAFEPLPYAFAANFQMK